jgi:hypothetical protein
MTVIADIYGKIPTRRERRNLGQVLGADSTQFDLVAGYGSILDIARSNTLIGNLG